MRGTVIGVKMHALAAANRLGNAAARGHCTCGHQARQPPLDSGMSVAAF